MPNAKSAITLAKVIWLTGFSGAGKSSLAEALAKTFADLNYSSLILDGDALRSGLNKDLSFSKDDRVENIRRTAEIAKLLVDSGITVIVALISPYIKDRQLARSLFKKNQFIEVHVDTPLEVCIQRDSKGLYAKALRGEIKEFTGFDSHYERPTNPELRLDAQIHSSQELAATVISYLKSLESFD